MPLYISLSLLSTFKMKIQSVNTRLHYNGKHFVLAREKIPLSLKYDNLVFVPPASFCDLPSIPLSIQNVKDKGCWVPLGPDHVQCFLFLILDVFVSLQGGTHAAPSEDNKLVRTTRVRRQTPESDQSPSTSSSNQTLREQPVVFNHVYNINVPLESLCSVDLDASTPPGPGTW